ncbi:MAG: hypothetical protein HYV63_27795 [Candidatus Schekmanbacteria bacterium]|nr:hypothetical protein [Candidatus Schekmanbacteria bacterium]
MHNGHRFSTQMFRQARAAIGALAALGIVCSSCDGGDDSGGGREATSGLVAVALGDTANEEYFTQLNQSVAALPQGGFAAVWLARKSSSIDVMMQWFDESGELAFAPGGRVLATADSFTEVPDYVEPVVAPHPTAGAFVAYQRYWDDGSAALLVQSYAETGQPRWTPEAGVTVSARGSSPHLVPDPVGGVFVCFQEDAILAIDGDIRCQHLNASGAALWPPSGLDAGGRPGWRVLPRGVPDNAGGLLVFWRNQRDYWGDDVIEPMLMEGQHFAADGTKIWGKQARIVRTTGLAEDYGHTYTFLGVAEDGAGGAILAFNDWARTADESYDVMAQRVSGDGRLLWGDGAVVVADLGYQDHEATIATGDGSVYIASFDLISDTRSRLRLLKLGADGRVQGPAEGVDVADPARLGLYYMAHGFVSDQILHLAWTRLAEDANDLPEGIFVGRFTADGVPLDGPGGVSITPSSLGFAMGLSRSASAPTDCVVWDTPNARGNWTDVNTLAMLAPDAALDAPGQTVAPVAPGAHTRPRGAGSRNWGKLLPRPTSVSANGLLIGGEARRPDPGSLY